MLVVDICWLLFAQPPIRPQSPADTAAYETREKGQLLRQHGDTIWSVTEPVTVRVIDTGKSITTRVSSRDGRVREARWNVKGDWAFLDGGSASRSMPVARRRGYQRLLASSRRVDAALRRVQD